MVDRGEVEATHIGRRVQGCRSIEAALAPFQLARAPAEVRFVGTPEPWLLGLDWNSEYFFLVIFDFLEVLKEAVGRCEGDRISRSH